MNLPTTTTWCRALAALALAMMLQSPVAASEPAPKTAPVESLLVSAEAGDIGPLRDALRRIDNPGVEALVRARLAASRLDAREVGDHLDVYWSSDDRTAARDALAWSIAGDAAFAAGNYPQAAAATQAWSALLAKHDPRGKAAEVAQFHGIASILSRLPRQAVVEREPRSVPTWRDKAGLLRTQVRINGIGQDAVLDTGANLSVVSRSTAERLGLRILDAEGSVASGSREQVATRIGVADHVQVAGVTLSDVVFLVLADRDLQLPLPGGYKIDAIIGFPVLRAIGRIRFGEDSFTPLEASAATAGAAATANLHAVGNDLLVEAVVGGIPVPLHLDTGAPASALSTRFAHRHPGILQGLARRDRRSASAGGSITQESAVWENVRVEIDGHQVTLPKLAIAVSDAAAVETRTFGTLGLDVLAGFDAFTLDLGTMRLEMEEDNKPH